MNILIRPVTPGLPPAWPSANRCWPLFAVVLRGGYLLAVSETAPELGLELQPLKAVVGEPPLFSEAQLLFYRRAAAYYQTPLGEALFALLPGGLQPRPVTRLSLGRRLYPAPARAARGR